jgi:hypothetical protein
MEGNHYEEVILDLQRKRDELGAVINLLMKLGNPKPVAAAVVPPAAVVAASGDGKKGRRSRPAPCPAPRGDGSDRVCKKCDTLKLLEEFPKNSACLGGHTWECKTCAADRGKRQREKKLAQADLAIYPKECLLCHDPFSSAKRYRDHMKKVHGKEI